MGFLDNVKGALKDALSTQASKNQAAAKRGAAVVDQPASTTADESAKAKLETYTVKSGDSLAEIGARFGVTDQEIAELNNIENPDLIFPGQVFRIPKG